MRAIMHETQTMIVLGVITGKQYYAERMHESLQKNEWIGLIIDELRDYYYDYCYTRINENKTLVLYNMTQMKTVS